MKILFTLDTSAHCTVNSQYIFVKRLIQDSKKVGNSISVGTS